MKNCWLGNFIIKGNNEIGFLVALEENKEVPFDFKRVYFIYGVPDFAVRGKHAHRKLKQLLICVNGSITIECEDIDGIQEEYVLNNPSKGLYLGSMVWHTMTHFSENSVLLVIADDFYDENDYIRDYNEFLILSNRKV